MTQEELEEILKEIIETPEYKWCVEQIEQAKKSGDGEEDDTPEEDESE